MLSNGQYTHEHDTLAAERGVPDGIIPKFYREKQFNPSKSKEAGRAIFEEYDAIELMIPGDHTTVHKDRATDEWVKRFPKQWSAYKDGMEQINGMPLEAWHEMIPHPGAIEEFRAMKIRSVEDLANLSDAFIARAPMGLEWRKKAQMEVERRKNADALIEANSELTAKVEAMAKRLEELEAGKIEPGKTVIVTIGEGGGAGGTSISGAGGAGGAGSSGGGGSGRGPGRPPKAA